MVKKVPTGVGFLDALLDGGYEDDAITTVYGPAGVGKTNLALLAAVQAANDDKKVIYIDTEGGFSVTRLKQLVSNPKKVLNNIIFLNPVTFEEQKRAFDKLAELLTKKVALVIVDTISMLYRLERKQGEEFFDFNRELAAQIARLTEITRRQKVPVLMTNQVYTSFKDGTKMVGGDILTYGSKCLIELSPRGANKRLTLKKHRSLPTGTSVLFRIVQSGIEEVDYSGVNSS
ncbi:DNA repair and recombination protein RadB [Candidatus Woesearchaeota archaeon]|nr:DNA repair and recombination protein RadB [Candidatus Woesearchaeota archaeon]